MQEIIVKKNKFQFEAFMDSILAYMSSQMGEALNALDAVMIFPPDGDSGFIGVDCMDKKDLLSKLADGNSLFFVFRAPDFGRPRKCADGQVHKKNKKDDRFIDNQSALGFLIRLEDNRIYVNSATASSDEVGNWLSVRDSVLFDEPMKNYLNGFIWK